MAKHKYTFWLKDRSEPVEIQGLLKRTDEEEHFYIEIDNLDPKGAGNDSVFEAWIKKSEVQAWSAEYHW